MTSQHYETFYESVSQEVLLGNEVWEPLETNKILRAQDHVGAIPKKSL